MYKEVDDDNSSLDDEESNLSKTKRSQKNSELNENFEKERSRNDSLMKQSIVNLTPKLEGILKKFV